MLFMGVGASQVYLEIKSRLRAGISHNLKQIYLAGWGDGNPYHTPEVTGLVRGRALSTGLESLLFPSLYAVCSPILMVGSDMEIQLLKN